MHEPNFSQPGEFQRTLIKPILAEIKPARTNQEISLAFIFPIRIMRALPHLAALVHRFLTYLSRAYKSRLSKKLQHLWVFRLATMFYAPVNLSRLFQGVVFCLRLPFSKEARCHLKH